MAWATSGEVLQALADTLKRSVGDLDASIGRIVVRAIEKANGEISGALAARGFTLAQVSAWPRLHEFSLEQSLFNAESILRKMFVDRAGDLLKAQDRTAELAVVVLTDAAGLPITTTGAATAGVLKVRSDYDARRERERQWRRGYGCDETGVRF